MRRVLTAILLLLAVAAFAQTNVQVDITATTSENAYVRPLFWKQWQTIADADSGNVWWLNPAATAWSDTFDSGIAVPTHVESDSGVILTWTDGDNEDHYILEYTVDRGYGTTSWAEVDSNIAADTDSFYWSAAPRGELNFRLRGANATNDTVSAVALVDSLEYNQAARIYAQFHAITDTMASFTTIANSGTDSEVITATKVE